ncbi:unnamed protein product [Sphagnum tenellum]
MDYDCIIIGAGGAGLMCAIEAGKRGRKVLLLDHAFQLGRKILISGGGRCNFTNLGASSLQYVSGNPHFCKSALSRYTPQDFIQKVQDHGVPFHEKKLGQLFCDYSAKNIVSLLKKECDQVGVQFQLGTQILSISPTSAAQATPFSVTVRAITPAHSPDLAALPQASYQNEEQTLQCRSLVIATGGLSIPKIGATGLGYDIAKQFGLSIIPTQPALDGFRLEPELSSLAGVSLDCVIEVNGISFRENLLFTHTGMSGPAALQASLHWNEGDPIRIDLLPELDCLELLLTRKASGSRSQVKNILSELMPRRLAEYICEHFFAASQVLPIAQISDQALQELSYVIKNWTLYPSGTVGYAKAEVTRGGVDTGELSSKTMESKKVPGLYFIGEVMDVTGWLGGYNFQWAWSSGWAAGQVV